MRENRDSMAGRLGILGGLLRVAMIVVLLVLPSLSQSHSMTVTGDADAGPTFEAVQAATASIAGDGHSHAQHSHQAQCDDGRSTPHDGLSQDDTCCYGLCFVAACAVGAGAAFAGLGRDGFEWRLDGLISLPAARLYEPPIA